MERPHFEITYVPKESGLIKKLQRKLEQAEEFEREVHRVLSQHSIVPTKLYITKADEGTGSNDGLFEGFKYVKFNGKVRGTQKKAFGLMNQKWKSDFDIHLLYGKEGNKDGMMFSTKITSKEKPQIQAIGNSIYNRLLEELGKDGIIPWNSVIRTGSLVPQTKKKRK